MAVLTEPTTGAQFSEAETFWTGKQLKNLGVGVRTRKVALMTVKVYAVSLFVDAAEAGPKGKAAAGEDGVTEVLTAGGFDQALQMCLARDVTGQQFSETLESAMRPHMGDDGATLDQFSGFFLGRQLANGTMVTLLRRAEGQLDVCLRAPGDDTPYASTQPGVTLESPRLGQELWKLYMGAKSAPAPGARKAWLAALPALE